MSDENILTIATREALVQNPDENSVSEKQLNELATSARKVNEDALSFLSNLPPVRTEHHYIALQLFRAAFDHARGLLFLIQANPVDMGAPALALHRSQIENFLRAVFLGFLATKEQVKDFLDNDLGVRELNHNNKWQNIGTVELARRVELFINGLSGSELDDALKFSRMVENTWTPLCGFVHGGRAVHALYRDGQGEIGSDIPLSALVQCVSNCFAITNFAFMVVISHIHELPGVPVAHPFSVSFEHFVKLQQALRTNES
ncbi:DUF6988 family protein [Xanthomonas rydalmerensis]|uniref:Uncharacterized protein n=1 Tax=Xanthomonas rydalmerensis TaxID=3046274 RepID=A0ABZ0JQK0_9XANT|nr:hypothetical protein [Xanthomonas sp. DM-2023]WOS42055.1 hypothetical protein QN243_06295 [Xanthomonas sp. DM-2023]WOS46241.1 hypothetical protein QN242_06295 [Xanthomonas sp. DM-2023]WOS50420.1 hypothetical protein QN240_06295 [Xanthomonas sp. DM-2023]WOS54600.1 hypothetical protein QN244_06295 [Xanthomonas sp. DM-2023]WOS58783.1 hypothetical protein QN245_06295 [Xanthomonas sp. DM-2023]